MKKLLILLFILPFLAKAQVPTLSLDTTYAAKANKTGVLLVTDAAYFTKLANADSTLFAQFDLYGKLIFRKVYVFDSTSLSNRINVNSTNITTNTNNIALKWGLTGNAGTTSSNFLGTTDNQDLIFKRSNIFSGRISSSTLSIGRISDSASTGGSNTSIGAAAASSTTTGDNNTSVGTSSSFFNTTGRGNTNVGAGSNNQNTSGSYNTTLGLSGLFYNQGTSNIGLGYASGTYNTSVSNQLFINSLDRINYTGDTTLSIIYGQQASSIATQRLKINGQLQINNGTQGAGKVLISDANGIASWVTPTSSIGGSDSTKIPLSGTVTGKTITGNLEFNNSNLVVIQNTVSGDYRSLFFNSGTKEISLSSQIAGVGTALTVGNANVLVNSSISSKGLIGVRDFSLNYDSLTYVQKKYVDSKIPIYQQTAIPFINASGIITGDSTKLIYANNYITIGANGASVNGLLLNGGRAEINGQFSGMFFNIGSGNAGGGTYDASKGYTFQNRGNTYLTMNTTAITGGVNNAAFSANITSTGNITSSLPMKAGGYTVATLPTGVLGQFTYVTDATAPTYLGALTGGGTVKCPVFFNGTIWVSN